MTPKQEEILKWAERVAVSVQRERFLFRCLSPWDHRIKSADIDAVNQARVRAKLKLNQALAYLIKHVMEPDWVDPGPDKRVADDEWPEPTPYDPNEVDLSLDKACL